MSSAEQIIYDALVAEAALTVLVDSRIYQEQEPAGAELPYVVFRTPISTNPYTTLKGDTGAARVSVQVDAIATRGPTVKSIARAIRTALKTAALYLDQNDNSQPERGLYRASLDFSVHEEVTL